MELLLIGVGIFYIGVLFIVLIDYPLVWISIIPLGLIFDNGLPPDNTFFGLVKYGIIFHLYLFVGVNLQNIIKKYKILNVVGNFLFVYTGLISSSSEPKQVKQESETEEEKLQREKLEKSRREKINRIEEQEKRRKKRIEKN